MDKIKNESVPDKKLSKTEIYQITFDVQSKIDSGIKSYVSKFSNLVLQATENKQLKSVKTENLTIMQKDILDIDKLFDLNILKISFKTCAFENIKVIEAFVNAIGGAFSNDKGPRRIVFDQIADIGALDNLENQLRIQLKDKKVVTNFYNNGFDLRSVTQ